MMGRMDTGVFGFFSARLRLFFFLLLLPLLYFQSPPASSSSSFCPSASRYPLSTALPFSAPQPETSLSSPRRSAPASPEGGGAYFATKKRARQHARAALFPSV
ncbi:hypothetical protein B0I35DRAFT_421053 [Stachybotrys elegans]|uniref:Uncharacterized protein n=1 Tax=Stachybotrys elegans TaxID=80388 RepID=A0A8K0WVR9_9HYPO|nr:hypothetical protein B0I35DRAFT_421053 [Stachybotrys elegans]